MKAKKQSKAITTEMRVAKVSEGGRTINFMTSNWNVLVKNYFSPLFDNILERHKTFFNKILNDMEQKPDK